MFNAGAVYGQAILDDSAWQKGAAGVQKSTESMSTSIFKGNLAFEAVKQAIGAVVNVAKQSAAAFIQSEKASAQLNAVLKSTKNAAGLSATEIKNMAASLQRTTTFEDDAILSGQNLLLTFTNIGKDVFPQATETMLDMSTALGQDLKSSAIQLGKALQDPERGVTALRKVGVNFNDTQMEMIKNLVATGKSAEAQALILKELQTEFGGSAKAARNTFGGSLEYLKNVQGDVMEDIGGLVAVMGKDFVDAMADGAVQFKNFITSAEGIEKISTAAGIFAGVVEVIKVAFGETWKTVSKIIQESFGKISVAVSSLTEKGEGNINVWKMLAAALKIALIPFTVFVKITTGAIVNIINFGKATWATIEALYLLSQAISGKIDWKTFQEKADEAGEAWKGFTVGVVDNIKNLVKDTVKEFQALPNEINAVSIKMQDNFENGFDKMKEKVKDGMSGINNEIVTSAKDNRTEWQKMWDAFKVTSQEATTKISDKIGGIKKVFDQVASAVSTVWTGITDTVKMAQQNELDAITNHNAAKLNALETEKENALIAQQEKADSELAILQAKFDSGQITEDQYNAQKKASEEKSAADKVKLEKILNAQIKAQKDAALAQENEMKKKQFETDKGFKIAEVWMNAGAATMAAWASAASIPFPGNVIVGGIMSGLLTGFAIAQTVLIAQQQFTPAYAMGGTVGGFTAGRNMTPVRMNERGGEIATLPDGTVIVPNDISQKIGESAGRTNINVSFAGAQISDQMSLEKVTDYVVRRIGRELRLSK